MMSCSILESIRVKLSMSGSGSKYPTIRIPRELAAKYSIDGPCTVEVIDREEEGGILIKKLHS